jgi:hypothetical protein
LAGFRRIFSLEIKFFPSDFFESLLDFLIKLTLPNQELDAEEAFE